LLVFVSIGLLSLTNFAAGVVVINNPLNVGTFKDLLLAIAGAVGKLVGTLGAIMIIVAGILYLTSAGSPERINKAKVAMVYAIAGIAIGLAASGIVLAITEMLKVK